MTIKTSRRVSSWLAFLFSLSIALPVLAAEPVDPQVMLGELQVMDSASDRLTLVWWIPNEYWEAVAAQDPSFTDEALQVILDALRGYSIFAVVDGTLSDTGESAFAPEAAVRRRLELQVGGKSFGPLADDQISEEATALITAMRPILVNVLGPMGENLNFFFFPAYTEEGGRLLDPREEGSFTVDLGEKAYSWRLPLGSVLPQKICPVDGEALNGAWTYCPWHGKELERQKQQKIKTPPAKGG